VAREVCERSVEELVADKGYHSGAVLKDPHQDGVLHPGAGARSADLAG